MIFVSLTRLRIRSIWYMPMFAIHTLRSLRQVKKAPGFKGGKLLPDRSWTFWTMTMWDERESMRRFMTTGAHKTAMPHLMHWCDEASVANWEQEELTLPSWGEADRRMRKSGRVSKVGNPSAEIAGMNYRSPRTSRSANL
jgi:heme-degrading monooxygenase HmoA